MMLSLFVGQRLTTFISSEHYTNIERLAAYLECGDLVPTIGRRYRLDEVPAAMRHLEAAESSGKAVIVIRDA